MQRSETNFKIWNRFHLKSTTVFVLRSQAVVLILQNAFCCVEIYTLNYSSGWLCIDSDPAVRDDRVQVSLNGNSLARCELSAGSWELLWELRTSIQTMIYRNLSNPDNIVTNAAQDGKLISLLVELLNNTDYVQNHNSDSEVD